MSYNENKCWIHICHLSLDRCCNPHKCTVRASVLSSKPHIQPRCCFSLTAKFCPDAAKFDCQLKDVIIRHVASCISLSSCSLALLTKAEAARPAPIPQETILVWIFLSHKTRISEITGCKIISCHGWKEGETRTWFEFHKKKNNPCGAQ